jgi:hypothetical protein
VNALATFSLRWLLPRLTLFRDSHPDIEVRLTTSNDPLDALAEPFDVVIRGGPDTFHGFQSRPLLSERRLPVCSPALLRRLPLSELADLERHTLLHVTSMPRLWRDWFRVAGVSDATEAGSLTLDHFYLANPGGDRRLGRGDGADSTGGRRSGRGTPGDTVPGNQPAGTRLLRVSAPHTGRRPRQRGILRLAGEGRSEIVCMTNG